jgi:electron transfer flavoprotein beta subunit
VSDLSLKDTAMRMYVCIKHVPDTAANIRLMGGVAFDETVKFIMNPYDEHALEQALQIKDNKGAGEVIVISVGKEAAVATLRFALAMGADRGILVKTADYFTDSRETAHLLKQAIVMDGSPGLILTGKQSVDTEGMQMPYHLAALLDMPVVVGVVAFSLAGEVVTVEREGEGDIREVIEMTMPCVVGAAKGLNRPRCPTLPDIMKARKKEIRVINRDEFDMNCPVETTEILSLQAVPDRGRGVILQDSPENMVRELLRRLKEEAKVL